MKDYVAGMVRHDFTNCPEDKTVAVLKGHWYSDILHHDSDGWLSGKEPDAWLDESSEAKHEASRAGFVGAHLQEFYENEISRLNGVIDGLMVALHDSIRRPMGVVPASAEEFLKRQ